MERSEDEASFEPKIEIHRDQAFLYFECHDVGNFATGDFGTQASQRS